MHTPLPIFSKNPRYGVREVARNAGLDQVGSAPFPAGIRYKHSTSAGWHDALPFPCVMFGVSVRHEPSSFNDLRYMHTPPPVLGKIRDTVSSRWQKMTLGPSAPDSRLPAPDSASPSVFVQRGAV